MNAFHRPPPQSAARRGFTIFELMVAGMILGTIALCLAPILRWIGVERKIVEQRVVALAEVNSALETFRAGGRPVPEQAVEVPLPAELTGFFPKGKLTLTASAVAKEGDGEPAEALPEGRWLVGTLEWTPIAAAKSQSVSQAIWIAGGAK